MIGDSTLYKTGPSFLINPKVLEFGKNCAKTRTKGFLIWQHHDPQTLTQRISK
jgi:hypothetical protein